MTRPLYFPPPSRTNLSWVDRATDGSWRRPCLRIGVDVRSGGQTATKTAFLLLDHDPGSPDILAGIIARGALGAALKEYAGWYEREAEALRGDARDLQALLVAGRGGVS